MVLPDSVKLLMLKDQLRISEPCMIRSILFLIHQKSLIFAFYPCFSINVLFLCILLLFKTDYLIFFVFQYNSSCKAYHIENSNPVFRYWLNGQFKLRKKCDSKILQNILIDKAELIAFVCVRASTVDVRCDRRSSSS